MKWDPALYTRYEGDRMRPALELLARVRCDEAESIVDLGCGTGNVTGLLAERWPEAKVLGIDTSESMLERAREEAPSRIVYERRDIADFAAQPVAEHDLLYSNAALHWLPDHEALFPALLGRLRPGGVLAVQMPLSFDQPYAREMRAILDENDFGSATLRDRVGRRPVYAADWYWRQLFETVADIDLWETEYQHQLEGDDPIVAWTRGTALRPVLDELDPEEGERFLDLYREAVAPLYRKRGSTTLFPFRRLFLIARL